MSDSPSLIRDFAHELRNAISPIRSAADVLRVRGSDPVVLDKSLAHIRRSLDAALQTIDAFVTAERAMSGTLSLDTGAHSLADLIDEAIVRIKAIDARETPRFVVAPFDTPLYVHVDRDQTIAVISTVLEHARAACAEDGDISVTVEREAGHAKLRVRFPTITPTPDIEAQFATFRAPAGLGMMALRTARQIVELQQGALDSTEDPGAGTREITLSFTRGTEPQEDAGAPAPQANGHASPAAQGKTPHLPMTILLVDDNLALRTSYSEALTELGYDVIAAGDGEEAMKLAESRKPDVALIDIHLPTVNGYQVARALKSKGATKAIRLVMLSGMTLDETTRRLSLNAGFDDCIDKMAGPSALDALLHAS
ncbi:MAG TPA: response regulator [Casimicrobiaceae bacterium]|jgi:CheY-like chemotaxis protein